MGSVAYRDLFPEYSGPGRMDDTWWARYGLEEAAMDGGNMAGPYPAHDRLAALMRGEQVAP